MRPSRKKSEDKFINDADSKHASDYKNEPKKINDRYKVYTFSLDQTTSEKIDQLTLKTRSFRVNRSEIVRASIQYLENASIEVLEDLIKKVKK